MRNSVASLFILTLLLLFPLTSVDFLEDDKRSDAAATGVYDVPTWRIGDEWVYETKFDVQQLITQANVSATLNTLTGDTKYEVTDIFFINIDNVQTLVYKMEITGSFTSGNNGAFIEDTPVGDANGRLDIDYDGEDIIRVRDLAVVNSDFTLDVTFAPFNIGLFATDLALISFDTSYSPPKEKYDFPLHTGDQWYMEFFSSTVAGGTSEYFDPSEFDTAGPENNSWQITANGVPTDGTELIDYSGCDDSFKINEWNQTGVSAGFNWYCPAVRYNSWMRVSNSAGFTIDWLLKSYTPADSWGVLPDSDPGERNLIVDVELQYLATLPNSEQTLTATYKTSPGGTPIDANNMQVRYEAISLLANPITNSSGMFDYVLNVSTGIDDTPSSDDYSSNGVIVWDPVAKIIGAVSVVIDLNVVGVDLVAKADSIIVERNRGGIISILSKANGYNALANDTLSFSIPAQNRGVLTSNATEIEVTTPDGTTIRSNIPGVAPYSEQRVIVNWTVPEGADIGDQILEFVVDPDEMITEDSNRSNNMASIIISIGRLPTADLNIYDEGKYTFENVTINASASFDEDGGDILCRFQIQYAPLLIDNIDSESCVINYIWNDDGAWNVTVIAIDDELDEDIITIQANILNRAPTFNLSGPIAVDVGSQVSFEAADVYDQDTITEDPSQQVIFSWPGTMCDGTILGPTCTFTAIQEGEMDITLVGTDDDGEAVTITKKLEILNVNPTIGEIEFWSNGVFVEKDIASGVWSINESTDVQLRITADDTPLDREDLIINWKPSDRDSNWSITTDGPDSVVNLSWNTSGFHEITVKATDDNGATSQILYASVMVKNIAPVLKTMNTIYNISEDDVIPLVADAIDNDELTYCWDLNPSVDDDDNGILDDDCDQPGAELEFSKAYSGYYEITANVWDDDGERDNHTLMINVLNQRPIAVIDNAENGFTITQRTYITLSGINSIDSASDGLTLRYIWDDPTIPGLEDGVGDEFKISFDEPGTYVVSLTVYDDDAESTTASISITVTEFIDDSAFGSAGTGTTLTISFAALIIIVLLAVLLLRRRPNDADILDLGMGDSLFNNEPKYDSPPMGLPAQTTATGQTFYQQYAQQPAQQPAQPAYQQPAQPAYQQPVQPAYQQPAQPAYQQPAVQQAPLTNQAPTTQPNPMIQEPTVAGGSTDLSDMLDGLDL